MQYTNSEQKVVGANDIASKINGIWRKKKLIESNLKHTKRTNIKNVAKLGADAGT